MNGSLGCPPQSKIRGNITGANISTGKYKMWPLPSDNECCTRLANNSHSAKLKFVSNYETTISQVFDFPRLEIELAGHDDYFMLINVGFNTTVHSCNWLANATVCHRAHIIKAVVDEGC
jgi:hypothetical protein